MPIYDTVFAPSRPFAFEEREFLGPKVGLREKIHLQRDFGDWKRETR